MGEDDRADSLMDRSVEPVAGFALIVDMALSSDGSRDEDNQARPLCRPSRASRLTTFHAEAVAISGRATHFSRTAPSAGS